MTTPISFTVLGDPKGQPRPKAFSRGGHAAVYDPGTAEGWKSAIAVAAKEAGAVGLLLTGPLRLTLSCYFRRPRAHYRTGKRAAELRDDITLWHTKKPDADNVGKAAADALTHLGTWHDDSQICEFIVRKRYTASIAHTEITIEDLAE
jgi:Holliday junction resolvase RusA-like endonuclease